MDLAAKKAQLKIQTVDEKIQNTFGPNPCTTLHLQTDDGDHLHLTCDRKRCVDCGPRKKAQLWLQTTNTLGANVYVTRIEPGESLEPLTRGLERAKKDAQRKGISTAYTVVGDDTLGHIVISDHPIHPDQRRMALDDWRDRILDLWHHSVERLRRSRIFGSVSLVTLYRKSKSGQSPWSMVQEYQNKRKMEDQAVIDERDALTADIGWHVWEENGHLRSTIDMWRS